MRKVDRKYFYCYRYMEAAPQLFLQMYIAYKSKSGNEGT